MSFATAKAAPVGITGNPKRRETARTRSRVSTTKTASQTGRGGVTASPLRRAADFGECVSLKIPVPVSINAAYRNVSGVGRVKTFIGPVDISIVLRYPPKGRADCSNFIKVVEDLLVTCGVIEDDSCKYVRSVAARWSKEEDSCRVNVYHAPADYLA
jgi:Holliday junction resolvase RusA-like endonuclease